MYDCFGNPLQDGDIIQVINESNKTLNLPNYSEQLGNYRRPTVGSYFNCNFAIIGSTGYRRAACEGEFENGNFIDCMLIYRSLYQKYDGTEFVMCGGEVAKVANVKDYNQNDLKNLFVNIDYYTQYL